MRPWAGDLALGSFLAEARGCPGLATDPFISMIVIILMRRLSFILPWAGDLALGTSWLIPEAAQGCPGLTRPQLLKLY